MPKRNYRNCQKCGNKIPNRVKVDGKIRNLSSRRYCLECSPFNSKNTKQLEKIPEKGKRICCECNKKKDESEFYSSKYYKCKKCYDAYIKERWLIRKLLAVKIMGGKCSKCGYSECLQALQLHHRDPNEKDFDGFYLQRVSMEKFLEELKKCDLYCSRCHVELHAGEFENIEELMKKYQKELERFSHL